MDQLNLQKLILQRYNELGIKYALPVKFVHLTEDNVFIWAYVEKVYDTNQDSFVDENEIKENLAISIK